MHPTLQARLAAINIGDTITYTGPRGVIQSGAVEGFRTPLLGLGHVVFALVPGATPADKQVDVSLWSVLSRSRPGCQELVFTD